MPLSELLALTLALADGPTVGSVGLSVEAGGTRATDGSARTPYAASDLYVEVAASEDLDVELSYGLSKRRGRGPVHELGVALSDYVSDTLSLHLSLQGSPPGGRDPGTYCLPLPQLRCVDAEERLRFLEPEARVSLGSDPEQDVVGTLELSATATFYRLDYRVPAQGPALLSVPVQEYRLGVEGSLDVEEVWELGLEAAVTLTHGALPAAREEGSEDEAPTELPLAPPRFEVGPFLAWNPTEALRLRLRAEYAPYQDPCLGRSQLASLRLTALPGAWQLFAEGTLQRDVSPVDAGTLARCGQEAPDPDYVSAIVRTGFALGF